MQAIRTEPVAEFSGERVLEIAGDLVQTEEEANRAKCLRRRDARESVSDSRGIMRGPLAGQS